MSTSLKQKELSPSKDCLFSMIKRHEWSLFNKQYAIRNTQRPIENPQFEKGKSQSHAPKPYILLLFKRILSIMDIMDCNDTA